MGKKLLVIEFWLVVAVCVLFVVLKCGGVINWPWIVVLFAPFFSTLALILLILFCAGVIIIASITCTGGRP